MDIKNAGISHVRPGASYCPAPFAYYAPLPAGVMLIAAAAANKQHTLARELTAANAEYLEKCLQLNPDYVGLTLQTVALVISDIESAKEFF